MAGAKASSVSELIAVAEIKEMLTDVNHKLDLLLSGRSYVPTLLASPNVTTPAMPTDDLGPDSWEEDKLNEWVEDLDGMTRYCVENGGMTAQEVWAAQRAEGNLYEPAPAGGLK